MRDRLIDFLNKYKYHFLIWAVYIIYEMAIIWLLFDKLSSPAAYLFIYIFYIALFYFHSNILLRYTLESSNKVLHYSLVLLIPMELLLFIIIKYQCDLIFYKYENPEYLKAYNFDMASLSKMIYRSIYFIGYSTGYYFLVRTRRRRQLVEKMELQELKNLIQEKEIKNELVLTQNAFLRSQINPDFLIRTLNYLYNETLESEPIAAESILSLSHIMQYALSKEASAGFVKLEKEISLIENFLLLHQARQVNQAQLKFSYNKESLSMEFIPLVLMTLTENILKHGQLNDPDKPAEIKITCENSVLRIETSNQQAINSKIPSHGIGLKNIRERLFLAYGETATFDYNLDSQRYFHTTIEVQIYSNSL
jgi:two-component system LytT family sensor kinase